MLNSKSEITKSQRNRGTLLNGAILQGTAFSHQATGPWRQAIKSTQHLIKLKLP
jgi:hypothetical protein